MKDIESVITFIKLTENLKNELRHSWTSKGRQESVADHSWRLSLLVLVCSKYIDTEIDLEKALKMAIIHDLSEVFCGDQHFLDVHRTKHSLAARKKQEDQSIRSLLSMLGAHFQDFISLWDEFEKRQVPEAQLVYFLDKLEVCIQHNQAPITSWTAEEIDSIGDYYDNLQPGDPFLCELLSKVRSDSETKLFTVLKK